MSTEKSLHDLLKSCEHLLRSVGESFWAEKIHSAMQRNNGKIDSYLMDEIKSWYGGMGSFNDIFISVHNNHIVNPRDEGEINAQLDALRDAIYHEVSR